MEASNEEQKLEENLFFNNGKRDTSQCNAYINYYKNVLCIISFNLPVNYKLDNIY